MFGRWIRKRALLGICALFAISSRTVATDSTAVEAGTTCIIPERETLKDTLESLSALKNSQQFQVKVVDALVTKISTFVNEVRENNALSEEIRSKVKTAIAADLRVMVGKTDKLREVILKTPTKSPSSLETESTECAKKYAEYLLEVLPKLQNALSYLYFQVNGKFIELGGGNWREMHCNGDEEKKPLELKQWLLQTTSDSVSDSNVSMLPGGYTGDDLGNNRGTDLNTILLEFVDPHSGDGSLSSLLHKLFYITPFARANTAAFLPYLAAFCGNMIGDNITSRSNRGFCTEVKNVCERVFEDLHIFTVHPKENDSNAQLLLLYNGIDAWKYILGGEVSDKYVDWMTKRLSEVIEQLKNIYSEFSKWTALGGKNMIVTGPFSYGFMYGPMWEPSLLKFPSSVRKLISTSEPKGSLRDLLTCLNGSCRSSQTTTGQHSRATPLEQPTTKTDVTPSTERSNVTHPEAGSSGASPNQESSTSNPTAGTTANLTGAVNAQGGNSDVKKSPFFTGGIIAIVVVVALVALGRIINVNGDALNGYSRIHDTNSPSTHREAVSFSDQLTDEALLITGIKVVDMLAFYARGGKPGRFVELQDTISGVKEILDGECDDMPEMAFYMVGGLQEAKEKAAEMSKTK
ncbi:ATP synthase F1 beta chain, putative [Babesia caballi]|uniref:ATP synthase subunit beta, mitochondrial n=1 Tax=Babesia caballi TaxID=5871 RepID=A0AAV4M1S0_BABCB|nr:ATP synthase F1 beta chain, putative [Babesia caballi]